MFTTLRGFADLVVDNVFLLGPAGNGGPGGNQGNTVIQAPAGPTGLRAELASQ